MWGTAQCKQAWQLGVLVKLTRLFEPEKNVRMRKLGRMKSHAPTTSLILIRCDTVTQKVPAFHVKIVQQLVRTMQLTSFRN